MGTLVTRARDGRSYCTYIDGARQETYCNIAEETCKRAVRKEIEDLEKEVAKNASGLNLKMQDARSA